MGTMDNGRWTMDWELGRLNLVAVVLRVFFVLLVLLVLYKIDEQSGRLNTKS